MAANEISTGAVAGIAALCGVVASLGSLAIVFWVRRRRYAAADEPSEPAPIVRHEFLPTPPGPGWHELSGGPMDAKELDSGVMMMQELDAMPVRSLDAKGVELGTGDLKEMA